MPINPDLARQWRDAPTLRIGLFRALVLGDLLCAVPAWRALKAAWPRAEITLIGLPWAAELAERLPQVDRFIAFPGFPGLPEIEPDIAALPAFLQQVQALTLDLVLQLHGSGNIVNPLVACFGAQRSAGFVEPGGWCADPELYTAWPTEGHEIERMLALTDHLGLPRAGTALDFPVTAADRVELASVWPAVLDPQPYACLHPGAQLPSRRWLPERFADVADTLAARGLRVVFTGGAGESALVRQVRQAMQQPSIDLSGRTTLWTLGALVERARLLVCNDTGVSHVAAALGTPSVVVSCGADVARWAPLDTRRHRVLWEPVPCRPCAHRDCPTAHECAVSVDVAAVAEAARELLDDPPDRAPDGPTTRTDGEPSGKDVNVSQH